MSITSIGAAAGIGAAGMKAPGTSDAGATAAGAMAVGAAPPKFGIGNGSIEPRVAGSPDRPLAPAGAMVFCVGGTLKVAVAIGDWAGPAVGANVEPLSADAVVCSNCCGMVAEDATTCSNTPGRPGLIGTVSALATALDASPPGTGRQRCRRQQ